jgi:NTP pyrophosphatase (non-canonical NTP hydrolase)
MGKLLKINPLTNNLILDPDQASIEEYGAVVEDIWPQDRDRPVWLLWLHLLSHATEVCEEVRKNRWHRVAKELSEVVVWWLTFIRRVTQRPPKNVTESVRILPYINLTPSDIVWYKYPGVCPVCFGRWIAANCQPNDEAARVMSQKVREIKAYFKRNPSCTCLSAKQDVEERGEKFKHFTKKCLRAYARKVQASKPRSLRDTAEMLKLIFANNIEVLSVEEIAFHLLEEVGEGSKSLSAFFMQELEDDKVEEFLQGRQELVFDFAEEIADVLSWAVSLLAKIYRFLECAAEFAAEYKTVEGMPELVRGNLARTRNIVDLIWTIHGKGSMLVCERCREFPCDPDHPAHAGKRGRLASRKLPPAIVTAIRGSKIL